MALLYFDKLFPNYIGYIWGITYFVLCILYYYFYRKILSTIVKAEIELTLNLFKKLFSYAVFAIWTTGAAIILSRIDIFMITFLLNVESVGYYTIALLLASIIMIIFGPIMSIFFPVSSKLSLTSKGFQELNKIIKIMYSFGLYIILPVVIILGMFPSEIINLMFGSKFLQASNTLTILSFSMFFGVLYSFNIFIMSGLKMLKEKTYIMIFGILVNVFLNFSLIPRLNIEGAAVATLVTFFMMMISSQYLISKKINMSLDFKYILKVLFSNLLIIPIIYILKIVFDFNMYLEALMIGAILLVIYLIIGSFIKIIHFKEIYRKFIRRN